MVYGVALHGLFDLVCTLWFGAGAAFLVFQLIGIFAGRGQWEVGVTARILYTASLVVLTLGLGVVTVLLGYLAFFELLAAVRGWAPKRKDHPTNNGGREAR